MLGDYSQTELNISEEVWRLLLKYINVQVSVWFQFKCTKQIEPTQVQLLDVNVSHSNSIQGYGLGLNMII